MRADILGVERRRRWSADEKARIVAETLEPGAKVTEVAQRNDVAASVLFTWRRKARTSSMSAFVPVNVVGKTIEDQTTRAPVARPKRQSGGLIEIDLGGGRRLKVDGDVDAAALSRVLDVLERR